MKIHLLDTAEAVTDGYALFFAEQANSFIRQKGAFNVALSGGNSPRKVFDILSSQYQHLIDWNCINFFFGDERYVPLDDSRSNAYMAEASLFTPLHLNPKNIFKVDTTLPPKVAAEDYMKRINLFFAESAVCFDLIMLGLGDNAHTASLFPFTNILDDIDPGVDAVFIPDLGMYRITFNAPLINQATQIAFLVYGSDKAKAVSAVLEGKFDPQQFPAQLIRAHHWFLDQSAAHLLRNTHT